MSEQRLSVSPLMEQQEWIWALLLSMWLMEVAWVSPLFVAIVPQARRFPLGVVASGIGVTLLAFMLLIRWLGVQEIEAPMYQILLLVLVLLTALVWLLAFGVNPAHPSELVSKGPALLMVFLFLFWWRAIQLVQRENLFRVVSAEFRQGVLLLLAGGLVFIWQIGDSIAPFVILFFAGGLMALAMARMGTKSMVGGHVVQRLGWRGVAAIGVTVLAVLAMSVLVSLAYSAEGFAFLGRLFAPEIHFLDRILTKALYALFKWLGPLMDKLILYFQRLMETLPKEQRPVIQTPSIGVGGQTTSSKLLGMMQTLKFVCGGILVLLALALLALWVEKLGRREKRGMPRASEELLSTPLGTGGALGKGWERIRNLFNLVRQYGVGRELLDAISVHNIYANVERLAARRGLPRRPAETPYEYLPRLATVFPGHDEALQHITEAYVRVQYGGRVVSGDDLDRLRAEWEALKAGPQSAKPAEHVD